MIDEPTPRWLPGEDEGLWSREHRTRISDPRPATERLRAIWQEAWVEPPSTHRLRERLFENMGLDAFLSRGRGAFVVGDPGAGTSTFLQEAARALRQDDGRWIALAALPERLYLHELLSELLGAIGLATYERETTDEMWTRFFEELGRKNVAAIAVDGMERLLHATPRTREKMLLWLRHFGSSGHFHLILSMPPALLSEVDRSYNGSIPAKDQADFIRATRPFQEYHLAPFRVDDEYLDVLDLWEQKLPLLHASYLAGRDLALHLYALCDGRPGYLARVLRRAAAEAVASGRERITIRLLDGMGLRPAPTFRQFRF